MHSFEFNTTIYLDLNSLGYLFSSHNQFVNYLIFIDYSSDCYLRLGKLIFYYEIGVIFHYKIEILIRLSFYLGIDLSIIL